MKQPLTQRILNTNNTNFVSSFSLKSNFSDSTFLQKIPYLTDHQFCANISPIRNFFKTDPSCKLF